MSEMTHEIRPLKRLAASLLRDAFDVLCKNPPPAKRPAGASMVEWRNKWERWERERQRELRFFADPSLSAPWCEMAGVTYQATVDKLERDGLLYDPKDRFPKTLGGESLIHTDTESRMSSRSGRRRNEDLTERPCKECRVMCRGVRGAAIHKAGCIGREKALELVARYKRGDNAREISRALNVSYDMTYRIIDAHDVPRRKGRGKVA